MIYGLNIFWLSMNHPKSAVNKGLVQAKTE